MFLVFLKVNRFRFFFDFVSDFVSDVDRSPLLMSAVGSVNQALVETFLAMSEYIENWAKYDEKYNLWYDERTRF